MQFLPQGPASSQVQVFTAAQTVTASSAYTAGYSVGGLITFANINRTAGGAIYIQSAFVTSQSLQAGQMDLVFFTAIPASSTIVDKTAFSVAAADATKLCGVAHITDWTSGAVASIGQMQQPLIGIDLTVSTLYAALVTRSTPTFTSTADITVNICVVQI